MRRSIRLLPSARHVALAWVLLGVLAAPQVKAQFRPPPLTESERLVREGEDEQLEASKAVTKGDKARADEKYRKALELFEQALAAEPGSVPAGVGLGAVGMAMQDWARIVERLTPLQAAHPEELELAHPLGVALFKLRRFEEAVPLLEQVSDANKPEHLLVHYYLASYYLYEQRGEDVVAELRIYLALRPEKLAANDYQIHELLGRGHLLRQDAVAAREAFTRAQEGRQESLSIQMGLGAVFELEGRADEARKLLAGLTVRFPKSPEPKERLGRLLLEVGMLQEAEQQAVAELALGSTVGAHLLMGDVRMMQRRPADAEKDYRTVLELAPGYVLAQQAVGMALQQQGRHEEAISFLEAAVAAGADSVELWATLGSVNRRAGRYQRAVEVHKRVVELVPEEALGHLLLGADHFATGQWDQTIEDYSNALKVEAESAQAKHWLALALAHRARERVGTGRVDDAVRDLRRAYDLKRDVPMARRLGAALLQQRSYPAARTVLEQAVAFEGATSREHLLLGYARLGAGAPQEAVASFEQAQQIALDTAAQADAFVGMAMAEMALGQADSAVKRLSELGTASKQAVEAARANLPLASLRRAFARLESGDAAGARQDVESSERGGLAKDSETTRLVALAKVLVQAEEGRFAEALSGSRKALTPAPAWARANARQLVTAYILYRKDSLPQARRTLAPLARRMPTEQKPWVEALTGAIYRREAERAYALGTSGGMRLAMKALKAALAAEPNDLPLQHNLACVNYRRGKTADAVATWRKLEPSLPMASLNLGIDAQVRRKDAAEAVNAWHRYITAGGSRAATVREWKERLQTLYSIAEPTLNERAPTPAADSTSTASETTP